MPAYRPDVERGLPDVPVIIGGAHVSALPQETMAYDCFDVGVIGEGDYTTLELVKHIEKNGLSRLSDVAGIAFRNGTIPPHRTKAIHQES